MPRPVEMTAQQWRRPLRDYESHDNARIRDFFVYEAQTAALAAAATQTDSIQIQADADFIWQKATALFTDSVTAGTAVTAATRPLQNVLVQITDTGSNRQLFFNPVPIVNVFGTGELPFILPNPRLFMKTSTIQVDFTSVDSAAANVRLSFIGYKYYRYGQ